MAILITVFECDECATILGVKTEDDWKRFEATWWEGLTFQFCQICCDKPETSARRLADRKLFFDAKKEKKQREYIN